MGILRKKVSGCIIISKQKVMAAERRRVPVGPEEINLFREGYKLHRDNYVRLLEFVKANVQMLNAETQALYRRRMIAE